MGKKDFTKFPLLLSNAPVDSHFLSIILRLLDVDDKFLEFWVFFAFFARTCREYLTTVS